MSHRRELRCGAVRATLGRRAGRVDASRILPELLLIVLLIFGISAALHTSVVGDLSNGGESAHATTPLVSVSFLSTNPNDGELLVSNPNDGEVLFVSGPQTIHAEADKSIETNTHHLEFWYGSERLGQIHGASGDLNVDLSDHANGAHTITVKARSMDNETVLGEGTLTVTNSHPAVSAKVVQRTDFDGTVRSYIQVSFTVTDGDSDFVVVVSDALEDSEFPSLGVTLPIDISGSTTAAVGTVSEDDARAEETHFVWVLLGKSKGWGTIYVSVVVNSKNGPRVGTLAKVTMSEE